MIKLIKSTFYKESQTKRELAQFIKSTDWMSFGPQCQKFEKGFAKYQGRKECILVNSGSSANLAIVQALLNLGKIKRGDKVGFSAVTWSTNVMPLVQLGLQPIPVDVELNTLNVSSRTLVETLKHQNIKMLFLTNLLGFCDNIDKIGRICKKEKILLIEDNCESLGTIYRGKKLGNFGLASTFSFYVGHHMSTVEGGAICTDNPALALMLRIVRAHGWDRNLTLIQQNSLREKFKINSTFYSRYTFYDLGFNFRPTEIVGFLGNIQLKYLEEINKKRNQNFLKIAPLIYAQTNSYYPIDFDHIDFVSNFAIPVICKSQTIKDNLVNSCANKIELRPVVGGNMVAQPFFKKYMGNSKKFLKKSNAKIIHEQGLYFGNNPELTKKEKGAILKVFLSKNVHKKLV